MSDVVGAHNDLHSEHGAVRGEHPGRSRNPVIKVADLAWLEFEKPDLTGAEAFARAFELAAAIIPVDGFFVLVVFTGIANPVLAKAGGFDVVCRFFREFRARGRPLVRHDAFFTINHFLRKAVFGFQLIFINAG